MKKKAFTVCAFVLATVLTGAVSNIERKFAMIGSGRVPAGSKVTIGKDELNAYVRDELKDVAPEGVRDPRLELGDNRATGYAYIDFVKLQQANGQSVGPLMRWIIEGEHPVRVDAQIQSGNGQMTVNVDRVEVSGVVIKGSALDYLIRHYLWSYFPDAKVNKPFELAHRIDRLDVRPSHVDVVIGK